MTEFDYDFLLSELACRLSSKMTPHEIRKWLIATKRYGNLTYMSDDEISAEIDTWYVELARKCGVMAS